MLERLDTHYHLDFLPVGARGAFAAECAARGIRVVAQTLTPSEFFEAFGGRDAGRTDEGGAGARTGGAASLPTVLPSLGFHPWRIPEIDVADELELLRSGLSRTRFIGEVGLDYAPKRLEGAPAEAQREVFSGLLAALVDAWSPEMRPFVLSIHTARSASDILDLLEATGAVGSALVPVFHRFNGTSDELVRLLRLGAFVSVHPAMPDSKRGRAYLQRIPAERLLLESDLPRTTASADSDSTLDALALGRAAAEELNSLLDSTLTRLADLRGRETAAELSQNIAGTSMLLYSASLSC